MRVSPAPSVQALSRLPPLSLLTPDPFPAPGRGSHRSARRAQRAIIANRNMKQRISSAANGSSLRLAADIGGTFTDIAAFDERTGKLTFGKALSRPQRLVEGIDAGVAKASSDYKSAGLFLHGSTIAINTILERKGANTALLITEGFRDIYEIGRINRPDAYNLFFRKHEPLVERAVRRRDRNRARREGGRRVRPHARAARRRGDRHPVSQLLRQARP